MGETSNEEYLAMQKTQNEVQRRQCALDAASRLTAPDVATLVSNARVIDAFLSGVAAAPAA